MVVLIIVMMMFSGTVLFRKLLGRIVALSQHVGYPFLFNSKPNGKEIFCSYDAETAG